MMRSGSPELRFMELSWVALVKKVVLGIFLTTMVVQRTMIVLELKVALRIILGLQVALRIVLIGERLFWVFILCILIWPGPGLFRDHRLIPSGLPLRTHIHSLRLHQSILCLRLLSDPLFLLRAGNLSLLGYCLGPYFFHRCFCWPLSFLPWWMLFTPTGWSISSDWWDDLVLEKRYYLSWKDRKKGYSGRKYW